MARQNKPRELGVERALAERIETERRARNLSYAQLAKLMTDAGCPIEPSAIQKIEKGNPPRRIVVDEAMAFSIVFDIELRELLLPPHVRLDAKYNKAMAEGPERRKNIGLLEGVYQQNVSDAADGLMDEDAPFREESFWILLRVAQKSAGDKPEDSARVTFLEDVLKELDKRKGQN